MGRVNLKGVDVDFDDRAVYLSVNPTTGVYGRFDMGGFLRKLGMFANDKVEHFLADAAQRQRDYVATHKLTEGPVFEGLNRTVGVLSTAYRALRKRQEK